MGRVYGWNTTGAIFGVVLGGRLGYVLFYKPEFFLHNPGEILKIWHGGMSFHGGMLGVLVAIPFLAAMLPGIARNRYGLNPAISAALATAVALAILLSLAPAVFSGETLTGGGVLSTGFDAGWGRIALIACLLVMITGVMILVGMFLRA